MSTFSSSLAGVPRETIEDRLLSYDDVGGRMVRVGASWVISGGGSASLASDVLRAVLEAGSTKPPAKEWTHDTMGRWTLEVAGIVRKIAAELSPEAAAEVADTTFFVTIDAPNVRGNVFGIKWDGMPTGGWRTVYHAPPNLGEYTKSRLAMNLEKDVATISDWPGIVRRVAGECVLLSQLCKTVSPTCEIACGGRFYSGDAERLTTMSDEEISAAFGDAPGGKEAMQRVNALAPATPAHAETLGDGATPGLSNVHAFFDGPNTISGTDLAGKVNLFSTAISGSSTAGATQFRVTFSTAYAAAPFVMVTPGNANPGVYISNINTTSFDVAFSGTFNTSPGGGGMSVYYQVVG